MKSLYIIATLLITLSSCASKKYVDTSTSWQSVAKMEDHEIFVDATSITRNDSMVVAKEKKVFYTAEQKEIYVAKIRDKQSKLYKPEKWNDFSYTIYTSEYDCLNNRFRNISVEDFDSQGIRIIKTTPNKKNQRWLNVDKETVGDYAFFFVCDYNN